jgi:hypothetical protein
MRRTHRWSRAAHSSLGARAATLVAAAATAAALAACGDTVAPTTGSLSDGQIAADVAASTGEAIAGDVLDFGGDLSAAGVASIANLGTTGGMVRASIAAAVASCPYDAASQTHVCAAVTERGLTVTRTYQFRDAADTPTQSYDAANTASIFFTRTADGTVTATNLNGVTWTGTTHRSQQSTVTGLLGDETQRVWNGIGQSHDTTDYSGTGGSRHYAGATIETTRDVVMALPRASFPYPQSGTITRTVDFTLTATNGSGEITKAVSRTVNVTFNGTAQVPIQVNDVTCSLNLDTHRVSGCIRTSA